MRFCWLLAEFTRLPWSGDLPFFTVKLLLWTLALDQP